jgi:hypothetical protein
MGSITTQVRNARRRARKQGLSANLTPEAWQETLEDFDYCCAYCGMYCDGLSIHATIEHYTSLASGGGTCIDNCIPSCFTCNSLKGSLSPEQVFHVSAERMEQIRRYLRSRKRGMRTPEHLHTPIVNMRKRDILSMVVMEEQRRSEQRLAHGEKITLQNVPQQIVLKISNASDDPLRVPSYEIGVALTIDECIVLARDLLSVVTSSQVPAEEKQPDLSYGGCCR